MNSVKKIFVISIVLCAALPLFAGKLTGRQIMEKVHAVDNGKDRKGETEMILVNKSGEKRTRRLLVFEKDYGEDTKSIMYFKAPADVKGTGFLQFSFDDPKKDDAKWLYLPALKKLRRISSSNKNDRFMGTDFTYDDLGRRNIDESQHKLLGEEKIDGQDCYIVASKSKDKDSMYSYVKSWIRKDNYVGIKVEYYDKKKKLLKVLNVKDLKKKGNFWVAYYSQMHDVQENHKTIMKVISIEHNTGISDSFFNQRTIQRGRIR